MTLSGQAAIRSGTNDDVALAAAGDASAFERVYRTHVAKIHSLARRMLGSHEADEVTQDIFVRTWQKLGQFRGDSAFSTWLHRLAVNVVLMKLRKKTLSETSLEETNDPEDESSGPKREIGAPDLLLTGSIDRVHLQRAIEQLPPGYKQVFVLHDIQGFEHNEIAGLMNCSIGNSKSQLHKARMRLRELLQETLRDQARQERQAAKTETAGKD